MTSDHNPTPPLLDEIDQEEEDTEEDDDDNNVVIEKHEEPVEDDLTVTIAVAPPQSTPKNHRIGEDEPIVAAPISSQQPGDDQARKLFQRLWTDEDEIGLLQGFLEYSTQRGTFQNNPHDTALFYDQIKTKLQLDFNKNQLVEKLRRLKKKYRNVLARISSGKEISFKSPHDQATFEIACKIWGTSSATQTSASKDHQQQRLQLSATAHTSASKDNQQAQHQNYQQQRLQLRIDVDDDMPPNFNPASTNLDMNFASNFNSRGHSERVVVDERRVQHKLSKKRMREGTEDVRVSMGAAVPANSSQVPIWQPGMGLSNTAMAEEKVQNKISPLFRNMCDRSGGARGFVDGIVSPVPLSFASPGVNIFGMEAVDDKWRRQQILELEVYSKRLDLVQEQIKLTLEQLRSTGADC